MKRLIIIISILFPAFIKAQVINKDQFVKTAYKIYKSQSWEYRPKNFTPYSLLSNLKSAPVDTNTIAFVIGKNTMGDGLGGFYRWDASSTDAADNTYLNTVVSNSSTTGRWVRIFQKVKVYPQGILVSNGGIKIFYIFGVTDASGNVTVNLTAENTGTGTALFTELWSGRGSATIQTAPATIVPIFGTPTSVGSGFKTLTFNFTQVNNQTLASTLLGIAGTIITPLKPVPANTSVTLVVDGI